MKLMSEAREVFVEAGLQPGAFSNAILPSCLVLSPLRVRVSLTP